MSTLHITRGLPASGKSSFAKAWVQEAPENRDDTRAMIHSGVPWSRHMEDMTTTVDHAAIRALLRNGRDVIVDDTNLNGGTAKTLAKIAAQCGAEFEVHDFPIALEDAVARDALRDSPVGREVIERMHSRYLAHLKGGFPNPPTATVAEPPAFKPYAAIPGTPKAFIVDLDGTLAHNYGHRSHYDYTRVGDDAVHHPVLNLVLDLITQGYTPVVMSGRDDACREDTERWLLDKCGLHSADYIGPFMRATGDKRDDGIIKLELFDAHVRDYYDVRYVLDDRNRVVRAWRSIGLTVLQVADGDF
jgi:predicted kinase